MPGTPLAHSWVLWEHQPGSNTPAGWQDNMSTLGEFGTVEDFWRYFNNIPRPSQVFYDGRSKKKVGDRTIDSFSMFKKGIRPAWEDPANAKGSEWWIRMTNQTDMDNSWESLVLALIGEQLDPEDDICGCRVTDKGKSGTAQFRIELWLKGRSKSQELHDKLSKVLAEGSNRRNNPPNIQFREHGV